MYRKHGKFKFDEILDCDKNGVDELKPSPVKRVVAKAKVKPEVTHVGGSKKTESKSSKTGK